MLLFSHDLAVSSGGCRPERPPALACSAQASLSHSALSGDLEGHAPKVALVWSWMKASHDDTSVPAESKKSPE